MGSITTHHVVRLPVSNPTPSPPHPTARRLIVSVCVICLGVCLAGYGELRVSLVGLTSMLTSVVAESLRLVLMQFLMVSRPVGCRAGRRSGVAQAQAMRGAGGARAPQPPTPLPHSLTPCLQDPKGGELHPMEGLMYISSACMAWLLAQAVLWEWTTLWQQRAFVRILEQPAPFLVRRPHLPARQRWCIPQSARVMRPPTHSVAVPRGRCRRARGSPSTCWPS